MTTNRQIDFFQNEQEGSATGQEVRSSKNRLYFASANASQKNFLTPSRFSRDEMNLAEFPLSVLSTRVSPGKKTLEFEDSIYDKNGKPVLRRWIITAADKFGLPTASDDEVLLGLLKISVDRGLGERKVYFTRYELLKTLRWSTEGRSYKRLTNALDRLSGVRIKATNSFYDNEAKAFNTRNFGIIDEYEINSGRMHNPKPSFFVWSEVLYTSFRSGFIKKLDFDFFLALESAVSKRLYRFLDKHFWYRSKFSMNLFTLAHEKIGVSRTYKYPSSLRQQIDPAAEELVRCGFLSHFEYVGKGKATEVTFYAGGENGRRSERKKIESKRESKRESIGEVRTERKAPPPVTSIQIEPSRNPPSRNPPSRNPLIHDDLSFLLQDRGIKARQAARLSVSLERSGGVERAQAILGYFDSLVAENSRLVSRNAPGFLYRALESPWEFLLPGEVRPERAPIRTPIGTKGPVNNGPVTRVQVTTREAHTSATQMSATQTEKTSRQISPDDESRYLVARKREISRLRDQLEPSLLTGLEKEVRSALENVKSLVSESGFEEAVIHAVEEKIAKLFAVPSFDEWLRANR